MGQLIIPTTRKMNGPWFIDSNSLESLHDSLIRIDSKLEESYNLLVDKTAESKISDFKVWEKDIDLDKAKTKVKNSYPFDDIEQYVVITNAQGDKIKDDNLLQLLKDRKLDHFDPIELDIQIKKGPYEFTLELTTKYTGDLKTRTKVHDDSIFSDINYELNKWIDKNKPNIALEKWTAWFPFAGFPILLLLIMMTGFYQNLHKTSTRISLNLRVMDF